MLNPDPDRDPAEAPLRIVMQKSGIAVPASGRLLWIHGDEPEEFTAAGPLLHDLLHRYPRYRLLLTSGRGRTRRWLRAQHPEHLILPAPWDNSISALWFLVKLKPRLLVLLKRIDGLGGQVRKQTYERKIPIVVVNGQLPVQSHGARDKAVGPHGGFERHLDYFEHFFMRDTAHRDLLLQAGVPEDKVTIVGPGDSDIDSLANGEDASQSTIESLAPMLRRDLKLLRSRAAGRRWGWQELQRPVLDSRLGRLFVSRRTRHFSDLESLRARLGQPETILCLGNGPSSEDPRLNDVEHDCLFRVNWRWLQRGILSRPDMVFTGDRRTVALIRDCVFGFRTIAAERRILATRMFIPAQPRIEYATLERLPVFLNHEYWGATPTNGSVMLTIAAALEPKRLIISGIDLFEHPQGSYPGDQTTANAYTPRHDKNIELQIVERVMDDFQGELIILSEILKNALDSRHASARGSCAEHS